MGHAGTQQTKQGSTARTLRVETAILFVALAGAPVAADAPEALVATLRLEPSTQRLYLPAKVGTLEAVRVMTLATELPGRITSIARAGQRVQKGDVVLQLSDALERAQLRQARAQLESARADLERAKNLHGSRATSQKALDDATTGLALRLADRDAAGERLAQRKVRAGFDGIVVANPEFEVGEVVSAGVPIATLMQLDRLKLTVGVPGFQLDRAKEGAEAHLSVPALSDEVFEGRVHRVAPAALPGEHLFEVEIRVSNDAGRLRPGMAARARIVRRTLPNTLSVPLHLVVERDHQRVVFFASEDGHARAVPVDDADVQGDRLLLPGSIPYRELIAMGHRDLRDGQRIRRDDAVLSKAITP